MSGVCERHRFLWAGLLDCRTRRSELSTGIHCALLQLILLFLSVPRIETGASCVCSHAYIHVSIHPREHVRGQFGGVSSLWVGSPFYRVNPGPWAQAEACLPAATLHWAISLDLFFASRLWMQVTKRSQPPAVMMSLPWWTLPQNCEPEKKLSHLSRFRWEYFITTEKETKTMSVTEGTKTMNINEYYWAIRGIESGYIIRDVESVQGKP